MAAKGLAQGGQRHVTLSGCIANEKEGTLVNDARITIRNGYKGVILAYFPTNPQGCFNYKLNYRSGDSLVLFISHSVFETDTQYLNIADDTVKNLGKIILHPQKNVLSGVTVTTPPVWTRGDTTFFSAEHFKEGDERKLKDLVTKLPGFRFDEKGRLFYKNRPVEKFLIEGETLFSEKSSVLLNGLPVHAIQTIQVLDNQNHNKLMKGLSGDNSIFLNIGLKKEKRHVAFGDLEAGLATNSMYTVSPSWFLLGKKVKWGYAGNNNSTGVGFDWGEERDIRPKSVTEGSRGMMNEQMLHLINNFGSRRYVGNRRFSNHLQANYNVSPFLKINSQVEQLADNQRQNAFYESNILNDTNYFFRKEATRVRQKPLHWRTNHKAEWMVANDKMLVTNLTGYLYSQNARQMQDFEDNSGNYSSTSRIKSGIAAWEILNDFTHRISPSKAQRIFLQAGSGYTGQLSSAVSNTWYPLFNLPDASYDNLHQNLTQHSTAVSAGWEIIRKAKRPTWQHGIYGKWKRYSLRNRVSFRDGEYSLEWPDLSNRGVYTLTEIFGKSSISRSLKSNQMTFAAEYGWATNSLNEVKSNSLHYPIGDIRFQLRSPIAFGKRWDYNIDTRYSQKPFEWYDLTHQAYPSSPTSFYSNRINGTTNKSINFNGSMGFRLSKLRAKTGSRLRVSIMDQHQFQSPVYLINMDQVLQVSIDTLVRRPTNYLHVGLYHDISTYPEKFTFSTSLGYYQNTNLIRIADEILKGKTEWLHGMFIVRRTWKSKYGFEWMAIHNFYFSNRGLASQSSTSKILLKQHLFAIKNHRFTVNTEWYSNSTASGKKINTLFADMEWQYNIPQTRWGIVLLVNNMFNESSYSSLDNSIFRQDFFQLPLVGRYLFASIRYEL